MKKPSLVGIGFRLMRGSTFCAPQVTTQKRRDREEEQPCVRPSRW